MDDAAAARAVKRRVAVIGGGASALFVLNEFVARNDRTKSLDIYEGGETFGPGMPYSASGAKNEHITNVSCEEIPELLTRTVDNWLLDQSDELLQEFNITRDQISRDMLLPRLLFGKYLEEQFQVLIEIGKRRGLEINLHPKTKIADISDDVARKKVTVITTTGEATAYDNVVITTGHVWPTRNENKVDGYFDSPYPPEKLSNVFNQHVGLRGSSLTAVDAIKTLASSHGKFERDAQGTLAYKPNEGTENFKITMHSRHGLLPCIRFHFDNPRLTKDLFISSEAIEKEIAQNGHLPLDFVFEKGFKEPLKAKDPDFHNTIKDMSMEQFVDHVFKERMAERPFDFFEKELALSKASIADKHSLAWKEAILFLIYTINFSAKNMAAEDMLRVRQTLAPLVSHIIAYLPIESSEEMLALHKAGKLDMQAVGYDNALTTSPGERGATYHYKGADGQARKEHFETFIDCIGQRQLSFEEFPFKSLVEQGAAVPATLAFNSATQAVDYIGKHPELKIVETAPDKFRLTVPGVAINDNFMLVDAAGKENPRIGIMAVPLIGGHNPDFSALDVAEEASKLVMNVFFAQEAPAAEATPKVRAPKTVNMRGKSL